MILSVPDMSCAHCQSAIQTAIAEAGGRAQVDLANRQVAVTGLDIAQAQAALAAVGFAARPLPEAPGPP